MKKYAKPALNLLVGEKNGREIGKKFFIAVKGVEKIN